MKQVLFSWDVFILYQVEFLELDVATALGIDESLKRSLQCSKIKPYFFYTFWLMFENQFDKKNVPKMKEIFWIKRFLQIKAIK